MEKIYDFQRQEPKWQEFWHKEKIFEFNSQKKGKVFSIDTPPPTVSGKMHLGHAFSYAHQDIIARYHRMKGENVFYPFGTDDNGLPTEKLIEEIGKVKLFDLGRERFIDLCRRTIKHLLPEFISDWKSIGMSCDFSKPYSTISPEVQKLSQQYFIELYNKNRVYKKESPVLWCPECQTAIAQAEVQDKEKESLFTEIEFQSVHSAREHMHSICIATTRPELLPSCVAVFVHPKDKRYRAFVGKNVIVPIFGQEVPVLQDDSVDMEKGTGAVMCCTFGDTQDIEWYFKHQLPLRISIEKNGTMNALANEFAGLSVEQSRSKVLEKLKEIGAVKGQKNIIHTFNVHERCGTPIEILVTEQWFIKYLDLKDKFLQQSQKLNWHPPYMKTRLDHWIEGLRWDWCISRQRYFGIPIPIWYCQECGQIILPEIDDLPVDPLHSVPKKQCQCGSKKFVPEKDVFDTWVTSSLTPQIAYSFYGFEPTWPTADKVSGLGPMSLRPQAHDIINFWLFYTLARSYLNFQELPWQDVMISGFVLDPNGEKMSKSKGNIIEPKEIIEKYGADALRYWASQSSPGDDLRYSEEEIKIGRRTVNKVWNASNFSLMHLKEYDFSIKDAEYLKDEDKWILTKLYQAVADYKQAMDEYKYAKAKNITDDFFWKLFCDYYLEIIKRRLYEPKSENIKKGAQFTLYSVLLAVLKLYAPIMPHITEVIYQEYFREKERDKSIHLSLLPELKNLLYFPEAVQDFQLAISVIAQIRKIKTKKQLSMKAKLDRAIIISENKSKLKKYLPLISQLLNVKEIKIS
jgi:valyl-tRNA synthetase